MDFLIKVLLNVFGVLVIFYIFLKAIDLVLTRIAINRFNTTYSKYVEKFSKKVFDNLDNDGKLAYYMMIKLSISCIEDIDKENNDLIKKITNCYLVLEYIESDLKINKINYEKGENENF